MCPPSTNYRLKKFVRRNKRQMMAASLVFFAILAGMAGTTWGLLRAEHAAEAERLAKLDAEEKEMQAEANETKAITAATGERLARERESAQGTRAEKAYARTADVLDTMVSEVTGVSLATQKEITAEQKKFLTEVLKYYQEFAGKKANDEKSRLRVARAAFRVGVIESRLRRHEESVAAFRAGRDCCAALVADFPTVAVYLRLLGIYYNALGLQFRQHGQLSEAEELYRNAMDIQGKLAADFPMFSTYRRDVAATHTNMGSLRHHQGKNPEAEEHYRMAFVIQQMLVAEFPTVPKWRHELATIHNDLALMLNSSPSKRQ
ncbi:hypothetical protein BH11PLA2_BH11PLA2_47130 [soil metagenome]